jgi:hypothetical protein
VPASDVLDVELHLPEPDRRARVDLDEVPGLRQLGQVGPQASSSNLISSTLTTGAST